MANVTVTWRNPVTGDTMPDSEVDETMTVLEAANNLIKVHFIPAPLREDQHYVMQIKGKTELNEDNATLQSGGVANGDVISAVLTQRGGTTCLIQ